MPRSRFRWRYTIWYTWPQDPPTRQDLADFRFTNIVIGGATVLILGAISALWLADRGADTALALAPGTAGLAAATAIIPWYFGMAKRHWQQRRAAHGATSPTDTD